LPVGVPAIRKAHRTIFLGVRSWDEAEQRKQYSDTNGVSCHTRLHLQAEQFLARLHSD
jgi:hypothetical protein